MISRKAYPPNSVDLGYTGDDCRHATMYPFNLYSGSEISLLLLKKVVEINGYSGRQEDDQTLSCRRQHFPDFMIALGDQGDANHQSRALDFRILFTAPFVLGAWDRQSISLLLDQVMQANCNEAIFTSLIVDRETRTLVIRSSYSVRSMVSLFDLVVFVERAIAETRHFITESPIGRYLVNLDDRKKIFVK